MDNNPYLDLYNRDRIMLYGMKMIRVRTLRYSSKMDTNVDSVRVISVSKIHHALEGHFSKCR